MRSRIVLASLFGLITGACPCRAAIRVFFDHDEYVVSSVGETFIAQILIDANDQTPELEPLQAGLFSFGAEIKFNPIKADVPDATAMSVVTELDNFGFFPGAFLDTSSGQAGAKGNIEQLANPLAPYNANLLTTVTITNKASAVDLYPLELGFFRTLGQNEQLFLDGNGTELDGDIVFGRAVVRVVPETTCCFSCLVGMLVLFLSHRRRRAVHTGD